MGERSQRLVPVPRLHHLAFDFARVEDLPRMSVLVPVVVDYVDEEERVVHFESARRGGAEISPGAGRACRSRPPSVYEASAAL